MNAGVAMAAALCGLLLAGCAATGGNRSSTAELIAQADSAYGAEQWQQAQQAYERVLRQSPDDTHAMLRLANIAHRQQRWEEAEGLYRRVIERTPQDRRAHYNLAVLHLARAEEHFQYFSALSDVDAASPWLTDLLAAIGRFADREQQATSPLERLGEQLRHGVEQVELRNPVDTGAAVADQ